MTRSQVRPLLPQDISTCSVRASLRCSSRPRSQRPIAFWRARGSTIDWRTFGSSRSHTLRKSMIFGNPALGFIMNSKIETSSCSG